jgi:predicted nucleotidyltransferase
VLNYVHEVKKQYPIKSAYLYGSHVKGTSHDKSDIDIAFIVEPMDEKNYYAIFGELINIAAKFTSNIEPNLLVDDGEYCKYSFLAEVMETGQLLEV